MSSSLTNEQIEERYFLLGRMEILSVLNELIHRRESVTVYFNNGQDFFITTLLEARHDALIFDLSSDKEVNRRLPASAGCIFVSQLNGIRIQFAGAQARRFSWGGSDAFWIPLPDRVVRLQRRESYRILLPVAKPVMVTLFDENDFKLGEWPANDLSVGGLGFNVVGVPPLQEGQIVSRLSLPLSKQRPIQCQVSVRHITQLSERMDGARYRVGVLFLDLQPATAVAIQRFIIKIEHQRRLLAQAKR